MQSPPVSGPSSRAPMAASNGPITASHFTRLPRTPSPAMRAATASIMSGTSPHRELVLLNRQIVKRLQGVELHRLVAAFDRCLVQLVARKPQSGRLRRNPRHNDQAAVVFGQAFEPRAGIHRVADGGDDL